MTGPEPKSADLIATEPTTVLPWEQVRAVLADTRLHWLAHPYTRPADPTCARCWPSGSAAPSTAPQAWIPARGGTWPLIPAARSRPAPTTWMCP